MDNIWFSIIKAIVFSFLATVIIGPIVIPVLKRLKFGQNVRNDGPASHLSKAGTPTMGGIIFLLGITFVGLAVTHRYPEGILILAIMLGFGLIGYIDDFLKIALHRPLGLRAREKLTGQVLMAVILAFLAVYTLGRGTHLAVPFSSATFEMGIPLYIIFCIIVVVGAANAVNLTDGLDGLASGITVFTSLAYVIIALVANMSGIALIMAAVAGGCLGFLVFNRHPAKVFMGDTGSLALGGALGAAAVLTRSELFLLIIGIVYVVETLSVIIQVFSFQVFGRRVFKMSPLHHHFELSGWNENRIVLTALTVTIIFSGLGIMGFIFR